MEVEPELTEQEQEDVGRLMVAAALKALGPPPGNRVEVDPADVTRGVLRALVAADTVQRQEEARLRQARGKNVYVEADAPVAVATAFWMWTDGDGVDLSEVHYRSIAGTRLLAFAKALAGARVLSEGLHMLDEDAELFLSARALKIALNL